MSDWSDDRSGHVLWTVIFFIVLGGGGCAYECAAYSECRQVHPAWYCLGR